VEMRCQPLRRALCNRGRISMFNRVLVYKRTHTGDPNLAGDFGVNDCMGKVRGYDYDAVIGVGGIGHEPTRYGIQRKVNWVGINPTRFTNSVKKRCDIVRFSKFVLLEDQGPDFQMLAPLLAKRLYDNKARFLLSSLNEQELLEANTVIEHCLNLESIKKQGTYKSGCKSTCFPRKIVGNVT
ncbi:hypothetical protein, partial [Vibrio cholerae]